MKEVKNYIISHTTMALEEAIHPYFNVKIYDVNGIFYSKQTIKQILNHACELRCTDYQGRINAVRKAFPYSKKTPLVICPIDMLYAIPTKSPKDYHCKWIFPDHIQDYIKESGQIHILFNNGLSIELNCSIKSFIKQLERSRNSLLHFSNLAKS
ncbi:competence protein ComK [Heyndrickxia sp. NPDC080065]|uniref:competence protein ComK n=1 Tax=Heyndrickxia sp. NPDC080065 TaxID=3390568 RepID=UPI003D03F601